MSTVASATPTGDADATPPAVHPERARRRAWIAPIASLLVLVAVTAAISAVFWPGHANLDTVGTYAYVVRGLHYTDWHSAVWQAIWRAMVLLDIRSPGWMLAGVVLMMLVGLYLLLRVRMNRPWALLVATAVFLFPPVLAFDIEIGTDVWFAASIVCGFGFASRAVRTQGRARTASVALAVVFGLLAIGARPTAAPPVFALFCALALVVLGSRLRGWRSPLAVITASALATVLAFGAVLAVQRYVLAADQTHPEQTTYEEDLVALSLDQHQVLLPADVYPRQDLAYLAAHGQDSSGVIDIVPLLFGSTAVIPPTLDGEKVASLQRAWFAAIRQQPVGYVQTRLRSALWQLAISGPAVATWYGAAPLYYGMGPQLLPTAQSRADDYIAIGTKQDATGGPLQTAWVYVLVLLLGAAYLFSRRVEKVILGLLSVALLMYTVEVIFLTPGVTYRYVWPPVAIGTLLFPILVTDVAAWLWRRFRRIAGASPREQKTLQLPQAIR